jgi:hypothetical protein
MHGVPRMICRQRMNEREGPDRMKLHELDLTASDLLGAFVYIV